MGLFRFLADMDSYSKISKKYGVGAGMEYMEKRIHEDEIESVNANKRYNDAIKEASNDLKFNMTNYIRKNGYKYSPEDLEYLKGIVNQTAFISNELNGKELTNEWNDFCSKREYMYEVKECIKKNKDEMMCLLKKYNQEIDKETEDNISKKLDLLAIEFEYDVFDDKLCKFKEYVKKNVKKYKKIFKSILDLKIE